MKKPLTILFLCISSATFALAEPVRLKYSEVADLGKSLELVADGFTERIVEQGKELPPRVVRQPYEYTGKVRFTLVRNLTALKLTLEALEETRKGIIREVAGDAGVIKPDETDKLKHFVSKWGEVLATEVTVDLQRLSEADLNLDKNPVPGTTTLGLAPIINELAPALAPPSTAVAQSKKK